MRRSRSLTLRTNPSSQEEIKDMPGLPRTSGGKPRKSNSRKGVKLTASVAGDDFCISLILQLVSHCLLD